MGGWEGEYMYMYVHCVVHVRMHEKLEACNTFKWVAVERGGAN